MINFFYIKLSQDLLIFNSKMHLFFHILFDDKNKKIAKISETCVNYFQQLVSMKLNPKWVDYKFCGQYVMTFITDSLMI